jgi:hypothetical protein
MKSSTGHSHPALRRTQFTVVPLALGSLTGRYVGLHAAGTPFLRASYSGVSGAFAPFWILSERGLFTKHGFER